MTLKNFLAELSFIQIPAIKRHAKGLLIALEKSNRKEMLDYEIKWDSGYDKCDNCGKNIVGTAHYIGDQLYCEDCWYGYLDKIKT